MFNRLRCLYRRYFKDDLIDERLGNIQTREQAYEYLNVLNSNISSMSLSRVMYELGELDKIHSRLMKLDNIDVKEVDEKLCKSLEDLECSICLKNFKVKDTICITKCNHTYHKNCSDTWFEIKDTCPNCRAYV
jgi:hypothetical protein